MSPGCQNVNSLFKAMYLRRLGSTFSPFLPRLGLSECPSIQNHLFIGAQLLSPLHFDREDPDGGAAKIATIRKTNYGSPNAVTETSRT